MKNGVNGAQYLFWYLFYSKQVNGLINKTCLVRGGEFHICKKIFPG